MVLAYFHYHINALARHVLRSTEKEIQREKSCRVGKYRLRCSVCCCYLAAVLGAQIFNLGTGLGTKVGK